MKSKIIIVGGMGPQAGIELHQRIINRASKLGARNGSDFPEIVHFSLPVDDFISDSTKMNQAVELITSALERLYLWQRGPHSLGVQYRTLAVA